MRKRLCLLTILACSLSINILSAAEYQFGFAKIDLTPTVPIRLSGYGNRDVPYEGVDESLFARAMAIETVETKDRYVLVSVDTIGFPGVLTKEIHQKVQQKYNIPRSNFVICCTHSHTAPHVLPGLQNLYAKPLTEEETEKTKAYTNYVSEQVLEAVDLAIQNLQPGQLSFDTGTASFARNRRVLKDGIWTGFGENPEGPVDHSLPVLRVTDISGKVTRGLVFNYACHCTTFGGDYNRVNGDWAGYASKYLEASHPDAIALCTIGCGADANPERDSEHAFEIAQRQGKEIAEEISRLSSKANSSSLIQSKLSTNFGFAGLPIDRPSDAELQANLKSPRQQVRHHAEVMLETKARMGRLPETYPMPVHVWRFENDFAMVFLGGEVCVDYALRIQKELPKLAAGLSPEKVWVSAYANDVFAYVAPERMRAEGGYEVDFSMIYYLQPGRWSSGTEEVIIRRVQELFQSNNLDVPRTVQESLKTFTLPEGYAIEVIAAEPLVRDPINFALDAKGRLWVVEMGDYPRGNPESGSLQIERHEPWEGPPAGRIKVLLDTDQDGTFDVAKVFLDKLSFPTGLFPWRDGVLISGAPDLIFARDTDGDLKCDETEVLYTGFEKANPQHRIAGFEYGLDGWLYLSAGTNNQGITCLKTGEVVNISGRDCRIQPDSGRLEAISGRSQYGRCRDDFGNWFGNSNSQPLFQFVIEDRDLSRNPFVASPSPRNHLTEPATAPPVFPTSRTIDRFNDLHALDRFTSACSPTVFRDETLGAEVRDSVLICEPVHNLISRVIVDRSTIEFTGSRHPDEQNSEFISSSDNWFRPVRLMSAPDGSLWVCDMYRHVIEHPEWIPEAWQAKLDLYAGYERGRIYRIYRKDTPLRNIDNLADLDNDALVQILGSPNGWIRDTAQRLLLERAGPSSPQIEGAIQEFISKTDENRSLIQAGYTFSQLPGGKTPIRKLYRSDDPQVVINALRIWGAGSDPVFKWQPFMLAASPSERIRFELALAAGNADRKDAVPILRRLIRSNSQNHWIRAAILSSANGIAEQLLLDLASEKQTDPELFNPLMATLLGNDPAGGLSQLGLTLQTVDSPLLQRVLLLNAFEFLERKNTGYPQIQNKIQPEASTVIQSILTETEAFLGASVPSDSDLAVAIKLIGFHRLPEKLDFAKYLQGTFPPAVNSATIETLLRRDEATRLIKEMQRLTPAVQSEIQTSLLTSQAAIDVLLDALEAKELNLLDLNVSARDTLLNHPAQEIKARTVELSKGLTPPASASATLEKYQAVLNLEGDTESGRRLFEKTCSTCHKHQELGNDFGPKVSSYAQKKVDFFLTAILSPNAAVEAKYRDYSIVTKQGKIYSGLILEETATSFKLIRPDGKSETILRGDVEDIVNSGRSFMPEGLDKSLSPQDIADIISFIRS